MINIMEDYGTIKRLNVQNNIHTKNSRVLICFKTKEEAQKAIADKNQYPGWKASLYYSKHKIQENQEEGQSDTNNSAVKKNRKKVQIYCQRHDDNNEGIIVIHNIDPNEMRCHAFGLKGHKIKEYQTKQNIYIANLKKTVKSKLETQEEMQQYGKVRCDRYGYEINDAMICYRTQKEAEEAISQTNKGIEWHAEIFQINEGRNKKANESDNNEESKRN